jgi:hypothetical protein
MCNIHALPPFKCTHSPTITKADQYYDADEGLSGDALKAAFNDIIDGHTRFTYTSRSIAMNRKKALELTCLGNSGFRGS